MHRLLLCLVLAFLVHSTTWADSATDYFERNIRPLLIHKCTECHSGRTPDGDLDLSSQVGFAAGGMAGEIVNGRNWEASSLYARLTTSDEDLQMPPNERLSDEEIAAVQKWIELGAPWPDGDRAVMPSPGATVGTEHWAFEPVSNPAPPAVQDEHWCWTDVDRFILARLEAAGLSPVEDADSTTWLRRATLDLTGLPPTPGQLHLDHHEPSEAPERSLLDRLLGSRAYAERQGRRWLDLARYADTSGDGTDMPIPEARFYRDWVIDALDSDMPYDQFLTEQLAGDILAAQDPDDPEAYRKIIATGFIALSRRFGNSKFAEAHQIIDDSIDTIGKSMLGLSLGCARCHHHKFDPVTTEDYYGLYGYFASTQYPHAGTEHQKERSDLPQIKVPDALQSVFDSDVAWAVGDKAEVGDAKVHIAGDPRKPGAEVPRGYLAFLSVDSPDIPERSSGRLQLAQWIASEQNPLTARVMVNRIWQSHFGSGLVPSASNFGMQSPEPTHRKLLDYLAREFVESGWSIKHMHRLIMSSHVYYLSSREAPEQLAADEANELLWHFPRQRLDAETFRDCVLAVSGRLQPGSGGRHRFKPTDELRYTQGRPFSEIFDHEYRSVYLMTPRLNRHPMMALFDGADANVSTAQRGESTVPLQSLFVINGEFINGQAEAFAHRVCEHSDVLQERVAWAWQLAYARRNTQEELASVSDYLERYISSRVADGSAREQAERDAWSSVAKALIASNEFMYVD